MSVSQKSALLFIEELRNTIKNFSFLKPSEQELLLSYSTTVMLDSFASLKRTEMTWNDQKNGQMLSRIMKKIAKHSATIESSQFMRNLNLLDRRKPICIPIDDYGVQKSGQIIFGTGRSFDHAIHHHFHGHRVVDAACIQDSLPLISFAELQLLSPITASQANNLEPMFTSTPQSKIEHAIHLFCRLLRFLLNLCINKKRIWVLTDRWFPCESFVTALRQQRVNFLLAIKKNCKVLLPDREAMNPPQIIRRGRRRHYRPRQLRIEHYFLTYVDAHYFTNHVTGRRIWYKSAILSTLKYARVKIFAFRLDHSHEWRFFISNNYHLTEKSAFSLYSQRWSLECVHKDVKQYFGISKAHVRSPLAVLGHLHLSYCLHAIFCYIRKISIRSYNIGISSHQLWCELYDRQFTGPEGE